MRDTNETLLAAANYIATHGHHKGLLYDYSSPAENPPACALGAIAVVDGCIDRTMPELSRHPAVRKLRDTLTAEGISDVVPWWNDLPSTTAEDVILALKRAGTE